MMLGVFLDAALFVLPTHARKEFEPKALNESSALSQALPAKIDPSLLHIWPPNKENSVSLYKTGNSFIPVYILLVSSFPVSDPDQYQSFAKTLGVYDVVIHKWIPEAYTIFASVPDYYLPSLASMQEIQYIRRPAAASKIPVDRSDLKKYAPLAAWSEAAAGTKITEGSAVLGLTSGVNFTGAGVRIGVLSTGIQGWEESLANHDLPANFSAANFSEFNTSGLPFLTNPYEGTAILEIIHDIAPDASLFLAAPYYDADCIDAIDWLVNTQNVDLIVSDISYGIEAMYPPSTMHFQGESTLSQYVSGVVSNGTPFLTSAGNQALAHISGTMNPDAQSYHQFPDGSNIASLWVDPGQEFYVELSWNDTIGSATTDYDLIVLRGANDPIRSDADLASADVEGVGQNVQSTTLNPCEATGLIPNDSTETVEYQILIKKNLPVDPNAGNLHFDLHVVGAAFSHYRLEHANPSGSIRVPADAPGAIVIGAATSDAMATGNPADWVVATYSSQGPTNRGNTTPDVVAPAGVTTFVGGHFPDASSFSPFHGTSAAVPHAAGVAALMLEAAPNLNSTEMKVALQNSGRSIGKYGFPPSNVEGKGIVYIPSALTEAVVYENTIDQQRYAFNNIIIEGEFQDVYGDGGVGVPAAADSIAVNSDIRIDPTSSSDPLIVDASEETLSGTGDIYQTGVDGEGDVKIYSGHFTMNGEGELTEMDTANSVIISNVTVTFGGLTVAQPDIDGDGTAEVGLKLTNAVAQIGNLSLTISSFLVSTAGLLIESATFEAPTAHMEFTLTNGRMKQNQINAESFAGAFGGSGTISFDNLVINTNGNGLTFDSGSVSAFGIGLTLYGGSIDDSGKISLSGAQVTGLDSLGLENFELPEFEIQDGAITVDADLDLSVAGLNAILHGGLTFGGGTGLTIPGFASVSILNGVTMEIGGLAVSSGSFHAATGTITIPSLFDFSLAGVSISSSGFSIPSASLAINVPGIPTTPIILENFAIQRSPFSITMTPPELSIGGVSFSVDSMTLGLDRSNKPILTLDTASFDSDVFDILLSSVTIGSGGVAVGGSGSITLANLGTFTLIDPVFTSTSFSANEAEFTLLPEFDSDGSLLTIYFDDLAVDATHKKLSFTQGDITISSIVDASFGATNVDSDEISISNASISIGNIDGAASVKTLKIGPGEVVITDGSMRIAGFEFDFGMDLVRGESVALDVAMKFPADKLDWPDVEGSIELVKSGSETRVTAFTLSIQGGTIPGTDLGLNNLYVSYDDDGNPDGGPQFDGAGEFSIPNYFTVGMEATLFDNCLNSFKVGVYGLNLALGNTGVFFQDIAFGASGFCELYCNPCTEIVYETVWDTMVDCETNKVNSNIAYWDDSSFLDIVTSGDGTEGYLLPVNVSFRSDRPYTGKTIARIPGTPSNELYSTTCVDREYYQTTAVEVEVSGTEVVITFELDIALTAGPQVDGVALARIDASGQFDTTGWLLIKGDLTILTFPVAGAEFELNPSGPDAGVRLAMYVNLLDVLKGNAEVKIDTSKHVSGSADASLWIPDEIPWIGGEKLGEVEASFGNSKISGSATIHIIKDIHFGFTFEDGDVDFDWKRQTRESSSPIRLFNRGYAYKSQNKQEARFLTNWNRVGGNVKESSNGRSVEMQALANPSTFTLNDPVDSLLIVIQASNLIPHAELSSPSGITYTTDFAHDPNTELLDLSIASEGITSASKDIAWVRIKDATFDSDGNPLPASFSYLLIDPPVGSYTLDIKNLSRLRDAAVEWLTPNPAPQIQLATTAILSPEMIVVEYDAYDSADAAEIEFYLDNDYDGADGILAATATESDGHGVVSFNPQKLPSNNADDPMIQSATDWNGDGQVDISDYDAAFTSGVILDSHERPETLAVPSGRYYLMARISDGVNEPAIVYGKPLTIANPNAPGKPSNVVVKPASGGLVVTWDGVQDPDRDLVGYKVVYSDKLNGIRFGNSIGVDIRNQDISSYPPHHSVFVPNLVNGRPYRVAVVAYDQKRNDGEMSDVVISAPIDSSGYNAPHFTSDPPRKVRADSYLEYQPVVRDIDGGPLYFTLLDGPSGIILDSNTGLMKYTPSLAEIGSVTVEILVEDPTQLIDTQEFLLQITAPLEGYPRQMICSRPDYTAYANELYEYQLEVCQDVRFNKFMKDKFSIQYMYFAFRLIEAPMGMTISTNGKIQWTPAASDIGSHRVIVEVVEIGRGASYPPKRDVQSFHIVVQSSSDKSKDAGRADPRDTYPTPTPTPIKIVPITITPIHPFVTPTNTHRPFYTLIPTFFITPTPTPTSRFSIKPIEKWMFINNQDGTSGIGGAKQVNFSPNGQFAFLTGDDTNAVTAFRMNEIDGTVQFSGTYKGSQSMTSPRRAEIHPNGSLVFVGTNDGLIHTLRFNSETGQFTHLTQLALGTTKIPAIPGEMAISPNGQFLYTAVESENRILLHRIDPSTGKLTFIKMFSIDLSSAGQVSPIQRLLISPDGKNLYALLSKAGIIQMFAINNISGNLVFGQRMLLQTANTTDIKMNPQGDRLMLIASKNEQNQEAGLFILFNRDSVTGVLSNRKQFSDVVLGGGSSLAVDPSLNRVYSATNKGIAIFDLTNDGTPSRSAFVSREEIGAGFGEPSAVAISPNGRFLFIASRGDSNHPAALAVIQVDGQTLLVTPTPAATNLPPTPAVATPTLTPPPKATPTPTPKSSLQLPSPIRIYRFDESSIQEAGFTEIPGGFRSGTPGGEASIAEIPSASNPLVTDGRGLRITCNPGETHLLLAQPPLPVGTNPVIIRMAAQADSPNGALVLAVLDGNLKGSLGTLKPAQNNFLVERYQRMSVIYQPLDDAGIAVIVQLNVPNSAKSPVTVYIDNIEVIPLVDGSAIESQYLYGNRVGSKDQSPTDEMKPPETIRSFAFESGSVEDAGFTQIPGGFIADTNPGTAETGEIPAGTNPRISDGMGLRITCNPGEVQLLLLSQPIETGKRPVLLKLAALATDSEGKFTLALLDSQLDGSIATFAPFDLSAWQGNYRRMALIYEPSITGKVIPALQLAVSKESTAPVTVYIDNVEVITLMEGTRVEAEIMQ